MNEMKNIDVAIKEKSMTNSAYVCSKCGCEGLHACTGVPIVWTEKEIKDFKTALNKMIKRGA